MLWVVFESFVYSVANPTAYTGGAQISVRQMLLQQFWVLFVSRGPDGSILKNNVALFCSSTPENNRLDHPQKVKIRKISALLNFNLP